VLRRRERANRLPMSMPPSPPVTHEINRPLASSVLNAETGLIYLKRRQPKMDEPMVTLDEIEATGRRASGIKTVLLDTASRDGGGARDLPYHRGKPRRRSACGWCNQTVRDRPW